MEFEKLIAKRFSVRQFRPEPPAWFQEAVREIISKLEEVTEETQ